MAQSKAKQYRNDHAAQSAGNRDGAYAPEIMEGEIQTNAEHEEDHA
jgi:hypothetical protein